MSNSDVPVQKNLHASGTWRAIRSMAVPANVASVRASHSPSAHLSGPRKIENIEEEAVRLKRRNSPGYFETAEPSLSES